MPYDLVGNNPVIYIHIPKTGGTSLKHYFELSLSGHLTAQESYETHHLPGGPWDIPHVPGPSPECPWLQHNTVVKKVQKLNEINRAEHQTRGRSRWQAAYKFSFVRNPWDRLASMFHHHREDFGGLGEFEALPEKLKTPGTEIQQSILSYTQTHYLTTAASSPMQFIGRYENLAYDAQRLYKTLTGNEKTFTNWERRSANKDQRYTKMYVDFNHIYEAFSLYYEDVKNFKYTFTNTKNCRITRECFEHYKRERSC